MRNSDVQTLGRVRLWIALALLIAALIPSAWVVWTQSNTPYIGVFHDDSIYLVAAKSLDAGTGYRVISLPGSPHEGKYPPVYPMFLSLIWKFNPDFPNNVRAGLLAQWIWLPVFLAAFLYYLRQLPLGEKTRWGLVILTGASAFSTLMSVTLSSEPLWSAMFLVSMAWVEKSKRLNDPKLALAAGAVGALAYLTRVATLPLLIAAPAYFLFSKQRKSAGLFAAAMLPAVAGWMLWSRLHLPANADANLLSYISYGNDILGVPLADLPESLWNDLGHFANAIAGLMMPSPAGIPILGKQIVYLTAFGCLAGAVRFGRERQWTAYHFFALLYIPIVFAWNWFPSERFVYPIYPILAIGLATELLHIGKMLAQPNPKSKKPAAAKPGLRLAFLTAAAAIAFALQFHMSLTTTPELLAVQQRALKECAPVFDWLKREVPANTPLYAWQDAVTYLYSGHQAIRPPAQDAFLKDSLGVGANSVEQSFKIWEKSAAASGSLLVLTTGDFLGDSPEQMLAGTKQTILENTRFEPVYETTQAVVFKLPEQTISAAPAARPTSTSP